jgi:hypothetical protein
MTITLNTKEFDEAVLLWLESQGFSTNRFNISTKLTVGRGDLGAGTRMEVTLDPITTVAEPANMFAAMKMDEPVLPSVAVPRPDPFKTGPSFSRGHIDE